MRKVSVPETYPTENYGGASPNNLRPISPDSLPNAVTPMGNNPPSYGGTTPMSADSLPNSVAPMASNPPSYGGTAPIGVRYRVLVEVATERDQDLVRYLIPGAFSTVSQGRNFMQAGVFSNRSNAEGVINILNSSGLKAIVQVLN